MQGTYVLGPEGREGARGSDRKDMPAVPDRQEHLQEPDVKAKIRLEH